MIESIEVQSQGVCSFRLRTGVIVLLSILFLTAFGYVLGNPAVVWESTGSRSDHTYDTWVDYEEVTPIAWRSLHLRMRKPDGSLATVDLLRPIWWLNATQAEVGESIYISLPELGLEGDAEVLSIGPCTVDSRNTDPGQRVVTGKFIHQNAKVLDLHFNNQPNDPLGVTSNHPIWSTTQNGWVEAGHLRVGEYVRTDDGIAQLTMRSERPGRHQVFNLEIHRDHTYYVSNLGILAHNEYPKTSRAARRQAMRDADTPTSRAATSQRGREGRRQYTTEGHDGNTRVQSQHPTDKDHASPHWHDAKPKTDPVTGEVLTNRHNQIKYQKKGSTSATYDE